LLTNDNAECWWRNHQRHADLQKANDDTTHSDRLEPGVGRPVRPIAGHRSPSSERRQAAILAASLPTISTVLALSPVQDWLRNISETIGQWRACQIRACRHR
jgi:hypothetical protein